MAMPRPAADVLQYCRTVGRRHPLGQLDYRWQQTSVVAPHPLSRARREREPGMWAYRGDRRDGLAQNRQGRRVKITEQRDEALAGEYQVHAAGALPAWSGAGRRTGPPIAEARPSLGGPYFCQHMSPPL